MDIGMEDDDLFYVNQNQTVVVPKEEQLKRVKDKECNLETEGGVEGISPQLHNMDVISGTLTLLLRDNSIAKFSAFT